MAEISDTGAQIDVDIDQKQNTSYKIIILKCNYFCTFGATSCVFTLLPVFLQSNGITESQIGILSALRPFISFWASPTWSAVADRFQIHTSILFSSILISASIRYFYLAMPSFKSLIFWFSLASVFDAPISPIVDTFSMKQLADVTKWGRMRLWGAIGFGFCSFVAGFIISKTKFGWNGIFILYWILMALSFMFLGFVFFKRSNLVYQSFHDEPEKTEAEIEKSGLAESICADDWKQMAPLEGVETGEILESEVEPKVQTKINEDDDEGIVELNFDIFDNGEKEMEHPNLQVKDNTSSASSMTKNLLSIFSNQETLLFFLIILVGGFSAGVIDTFLYVHLKQLGGQELLMGSARAITCIAEIPFFQYATSLIKRFGEQGVLNVALVVYVIRLGYYSLLDHLPLWAVLPAETLHGFTFAALWAASTSYGYKIAPPQMKTTVQGLVNGVHWGVGFGCGALIGGYMFDQYGAVVLFRSTAVVVAIVLCCSILQKQCLKVTRFLLASRKEKELTLSKKNSSRFVTVPCSDLERSPASGIGSGPSEIPKRKPINSE